ncbi:MAG: transposase [Roseiflexus sp.]
MKNEDAPQRKDHLREVCNGLRSVVYPGASWRILSSDLPSWHGVSRQRQSRLKAGVFEALVCDVERLLRNLTDRMPLPCAVLLDYQNAPIDPGKRGALQP